MNPDRPNEDEIGALWEKARDSGMSRRQFLILFTSAGAVAVLAACGVLSSGDKNADKDSEKPLPVIFLPGIQGSVLVNETSLITLWPPGGLDKSISLSRLEAQFKELSLKPPPEAHPKIFANDVIRKYGGEPFYDSFLKSLTDPKDGYVEYDTDYAPERRTLSGIFKGQKLKPSLFVFPYDWRLPIEESAEKLAEYVEVVAQFYPGKKVNVITHSMGSLVARRYIIDHTGRVNKLITVSAPWLGAAKPLYQMIYGKITALSSVTASIEGAKELGKDWFMEGYFGNDGKEMMNYFPGVHELMLSEGYYALGGRKYTVIPATTDLPIKELSFKEMMDPNGKVDELFPNPARVGTILKTPAKTNCDFHAYSANGKNQDDWSQDATSVKYYHIIGVQGSHDTPLQLVETPGLQSRFRTYNLEPLGEGDGTVPLLSLARIGAGKNFNAHGAKLFIYTGGNPELLGQAEIVKNPMVTIYTGNKDEFLEHTGMMKNRTVIAKILELLREKDEPAVVTPPPATKSTQPAPPAVATERRWALVEPKLPPAQQQPATSNDQFGDNSVTIVANESEISTQVVTSKQGREVGRYIMTLRFDKLPQELSSLQKTEWRVTWEMKVSGVPRYTVDYIELGQGDFGTSKLMKISMAENPTGSMTLTLSPPNLAPYITEGSFEVSAKLFTAGDRYKVRWVYHPE